MVKIFNKVVKEYIKFLQEKIKENNRVLLKGQEVKDLDLIISSKGETENIRILVKYSDNTIEIMKASDFMELLLFIIR
jgi:hypothetical protein